MKTGRFLFFVPWMAAAVLFASVSAQQSASTDDDPFIWLEEAESDSALDWVKAQDELTLAAFENDSNFINFQDTILQILNDKNRIPYGTLVGDEVYNFWQDETHIKGIIRKTSLESYVTDNPQWEMVLDIDKLSADEGQDYVYGGSVNLAPGRTRGLIGLSLGGKDALIYREFDYRTKSFVQDGFYLPEAKSGVDWYDSNTVLVGTDFGPGSMTTSGYPRILKLWKRGTPLAEAETILEGEVTDTWVSGNVTIRPEGQVCMLTRHTDFWNSYDWIYDTGGEKIPLPYPEDSYCCFFKGRVLVTLNSDWLGIPEGSLVAVKISDLQAEDLKSKLEVIFTPDEKRVLTGTKTTEDYVIATILDNVRPRALYYWPEESDGTVVWKHGTFRLGDMGEISVKSSSEFSNRLMVSYDDFLTPTKLLLFDEPAAEPREIKSLPESFPTGNLKVEQHFAISKDGTSIPYFLVSRKDIKLDGSNPTLLYAYGGFRETELPYYSRTLGKIWFSKGGVYALANIRGGGEFGPKWHKAGLLENRQKVFDDFYAVAEDLINRGVTSPEHLGIEGGSNGGLLVGVAMVQRPELFKAVVCQVPLLDMIRYPGIGAGASWMAEYGNPDIPEQRAFIAKYSPYQNLKEGVKYPEVLLQTSTADDRVHPAHARKMAARMEQMGYRPYYYEELTGGHAAGVDNKQRARVIALEYAFLWRMLKQESGLDPAGDLHN